MYCANNAVLYTAPSGYSRKCKKREDSKPTDQNAKKSSTDVTSKEQYGT